MARAIIALVALFLVAPPPARAQELPVDVTLAEMVNLPQESPRLTLTANGPVRSLRVVVREGGRSVFSRGVGNLRAEAFRTVGWRAPPGVHEYVIEVSGRTQEGSQRVSFERTVSVMRPIEISIRKQEVDLGTRRLQFMINNPGGRAELTIFDPSRARIHEGTTDLHGAPAGTRLEVRWPEMRRPIARMELRVYDVSDSYTDYEIVPFSVDIPHRDVVFETARWEIRPEERPKLDEAHARIIAAIREHASDLQARLYILGHTDTVGSASDNMLLSQRRANAIARYFRDRGGITLPIVVRGFGETIPSVRTADNVDEARNRRAQYILAAQPPVAGSWAPVQ